MNLLHVYGNKIRIRACGICTNETGILLINHSGLKIGDFWSPPGGGVEFGESAQYCLSRELKEETGLDTTIGKFLFVCEYIGQPLHAIELFFEVNSYEGNITVGYDPEIGEHAQHFKEVKFMPWEELKKQPPDSLHGIFKFLDNPSEIKSLSGYFKV